MRRRWLGELLDAECAVATPIVDEGMTAQQVVEIRMFNKNRGIEKTILDQQEWRYNEESKRWLLHSGLPDPTQTY